MKLILSQIELQLPQAKFFYSVGLVILVARTESIRTEVQILSPNCSLVFWKI